jgi:hypothetical protein
MTITHRYLALLPALLLAGCATTPATPKAATRPATAATAESAPATADQSKNLRKGMSASEIRALWGEPLATHTGKEPGESILVYYFDVLTTQRMIAATVIERLAVDPISGETRMVTEPVLSPQKVTVTQTIVLQLLDDKLVSWARQLGEERSFN